MARGRMLNKRVSMSKQMDDLPDDTCRLLATWTVAHLDCNGVFHADPMVVRSMVFTRRQDISANQVAEYLRAMEAVGLIVRFDSGGESWQWWPKFPENQPGMRVDRESTHFPRPPISQQDDGNAPESGGQVADQKPAEGKLKEGKLSEGEEKVSHQSDGGGESMPSRDEYGPTDEPGGPAMMTSAEIKAVSQMWQTKMGGLCPPKVLCYLGPKMREHDGVHGHSALDWGLGVLEEGIDGTSDPRGPPPKYMDAIWASWNANGFQAPRKPYGERVDERADNRDMAERMRRELRGEGIAPDKIEAAIKEQLGEGY